MRPRWGRNTKLLFLTEQAADKVHGENIFQALWERITTREHCFSNLDFWKGKGVAESDIDHSFVLIWIGSSFTCIALSASTVWGMFSFHLCNSQYPLLWTLKKMLKAWSIWPLYVLVDLYRENTVTPHTSQHETRSGNCCQVSSVKNRRVVAT